jgi:hypothetical protein
MLANPRRIRHDFQPGQRGVVNDASTKAGPTNGGSIPYATGPHQRTYHNSANGDDYRTNQYYLESFSLLLKGFSPNCSTVSSLLYISLSMFLRLWSCIIGGAGYRSSSGEVCSSIRVLVVHRSQGAGNTYETLWEL